VYDTRIKSNKEDTMTATFHTTRGADYTVEHVDQRHAEYVGCPNSDYRLVGRHGVMYGYLMATGTVPGREVRVPGWSTRRGVRAVFVPSVVDYGPNGSVPVDGYLAF
jgi:hypothetical protein